MFLQQCIVLPSPILHVCATLHYFTSSSCMCNIALFHQLLLFMYVQHCIGLLLFMYVHHPLTHNKLIQIVI
jgi:hypothetical protein